MKRTFFCVLFLLFTATIVHAQGYEIKIKFTPFKNQTIYLGHYFGKTYPVVDSVKLDGNCEGVLKGNKKLQGGIYLIGYPQRKGFFEILIDKEQKFTIIADSATLTSGGPKFIGSPDNDLYSSYQKYITPIGIETVGLQNQLKTTKTKKDSSDIIEKLVKLDKQITEYRQEIREKNPETLLTNLLLAMREPKIPDQFKGLKTRSDSAGYFEFYKSHYWDGVNFWDGRLTYTPFFDEKVDKYFNDIVAFDPDSVIKEIDAMMGPASINDEMTRFLMIKFANRFYNQKYMWEDKVFVHLFEKYFNAKEYSWLDKGARKTVSDRAYSLMANIMGTPASDIELVDSTGKMQSLYGLKAPFTIVAFWDPTCGHCKEVLPRLDSFYRAKWKPMGIGVFAVAKETDGTRKDWLDFISQSRLVGWTHVYYSTPVHEARIKANIPGYSQLYDVRTYPTLYLLDKDKKIIAKKLTVPQIDEVLKYKLKGQ